ncbi:Na+/H+ antiporter family protein [Parathalassolituus penaei]|uniref:TRAP transporter large permease subunit n=1 Tax=Parathalassolituus penaei TaxID=2997323 RepID=A0A9X3EDM0_9GAMM|nr:Na+/H+ antiporter NhaC family protein [Parathalassolituus penaei]MCY0965265.1 TRAP transporter large permease subunit [Parathalassolituus penaei]
MNAVVVAVVLMLILSVARMHVMLSMMIAALVGGWVGGLDLKQTLDAFNEGIGGGAGIALSYAMLGAFAVAISLSGLPQLLAKNLLKRVGHESDVNQGHVSTAIIVLMLVAAMMSQNLIPIHIAFIPILVPPLLMLMARLKLDRRLIACVLTFGLITPYMFLPVGFGAIYLDEILLGQIASAGVNTEGLSVVKAMAIPAAGMLVGLLIAVFFSYRRPREYDLKVVEAGSHSEREVTGRGLVVAVAAIVAAFVVQLATDSMVLGAMVGFLIFSVTGVVRWNESESVILDGIRMMASIGFIMIAANGFSEVLKATGHIDTLVSASAEWLGNSKALTSFVLLVVGLLLTMGIGSSFSTVPIIAAIYVPLCVQLGFSPLAIVALIGTAGALGDAGSPASDSTLGPSAGLNADGQHNHMKDTVIPTFLHFNLPLLAAGWVATMVL